MKEQEVDLGKPLRFKPGMGADVSWKIVYVYKTRKEGDAFLEFQDECGDLYAGYYPISGLENVPTEEK